MAKKKTELIESIALNDNMVFIIEDKSKVKPKTRGKVKTKVDYDGDPIVLGRNGEKIDRDTIFVEKGPLAASMKYVSKMTTGIVTGVLSNDPEYIKLQPKLIDIIIKEQVNKVKSEVEKNLQTANSLYKDAMTKQKKDVKAYQDLVAEMSKRSSIHIFINHKGECISLKDPEDIIDFDGVWTKITMRELKNIRDAKLVAKAEKKTTTKKKAAEKKKADCPFDLENPNCNSKVANSKYEKALKDSAIHKKLEKKAKKKITKKKAKKYDRK